MGRVLRRVQPLNWGVASVCVCVCTVLNSSLRQLSSTPLQVLLYLNSWYFAAFYLAEILMFIYKGQSAHLHMKLVAMKTLGSKCFIN